MRLSKWLGVVVLSAFGMAFTAPPRLIAQSSNNAGPQLTGPAINYTLPKAGQVTLGIYDADGKLLRTVMSDESRSPGRLSRSRTVLINGACRCLPVRIY